MKNVQYFYASMIFNVSVFDKGEKESLHNLVFLQIAIGRFHCINCCCHVWKKSTRISSFFFFLTAKDQALNIVNAAW